MWQSIDVAECCTNAKSRSLLLEAVNRVGECTGSRAEIADCSPNSHFYTSVIFTFVNSGGGEQKNISWRMKIK